MQRTMLCTSKQLIRTCIVAVLLTFGMSAPAAQPEPGHYCPVKNILLITAEDLSAALDLVMQSREALANDDPVTTSSTLTAAGAALRLAASRGAAARTVLLIDTILRATASEDYARILTWIPTLRLSLGSLPNDPTVTAATAAIDRAESIFERVDEGKPLEVLREARHLLACDGLDIPLQEAISAQGELLGQLGRNTETATYDRLLRSLKESLEYALQNSGS